MPDLPPEIWTIIVKLLKREPPPAGQPANWDTHLHQQDLVSLQRVDKVSPPQTKWAHRCLSRSNIRVKSAADHTRGYTRSCPPYSTKPQWSKISASFSRESKIPSSNLIALVVCIGISLNADRRKTPGIKLCLTPKTNYSARSSGCTSFTHRQASRLVQHTCSLEIQVGGERL
jgi:hypothetical protein